MPRIAQGIKLPPVVVPDAPPTPAPKKRRGRNKRLAPGERRKRKPAPPVGAPDTTQKHSPVEVPSDLAFSREVAELARKFKTTTYGMFTQEEALRMPRWRLEFEAWCRNPPGGLGRAKHFEHLAKYMWPALKEGWNPWLEMMVKSLVREEFVQRVGDMVVRATTWIGCAAAGKTYASGLFSMLWWAVDPANSIVILTSTTRDMLRRRVWSTIRNLYDTSVDLDSGKPMRIPGYVMESRTAIQHEKHDDKHAIYAMAVAHGETAKAVAMMKGIHAERILLVIDEANGTPESIYRVIPNLRKGCKELNLLFIGNPTSHLDCLGIVGEPQNGWKTVTVKDDQWLTKGVPEWQVPPGLCLHFDGYRSPNVELGETRWPFIYSCEDKEAALVTNQSSLEYWQNDRGFYAGDGVLSTVFTESLVERCNGYDRPSFIDPSTPVAFLDPAFGGDQCVLQFGEIGPISGGKMALILTEVLKLNPLADPGKEAEYVIAAQAKEACEARGVRPRNFGIDAIGTGRGAASVLATEWSGEIQKFYSNERPSKEQAVVSERVAEKEYDRATTEHWFRARDLLEAGQLYGLYREVVVQFCSRQYTVRGRVYVLSTKQEHKDSVASRESPDLADACVGMCWVGRSLGLEPTPQGRMAQEMRAKEEAADAVHDEENAYRSEEDYD